MPDDLFDNEELEDSTQLFALTPAMSLLELLFVDETTVSFSTKIMCNKCGKIFQRTDIYRKHERICGKLTFSTVRNN